MSHSGVRKCLLCGSCWPAMVTLEAYHNYKRRAEKHPGMNCRDKDGSFGPPIPRMVIK